MGSWYEDKIFPREKYVSPPDWKTDMYFRGRSEKGCGNDIFDLKMGSGFEEPGGTPPPRVTPHWEISLLSVRE